MKILHIITSLKIGGAESALFNLLERFIENNNDQHYVAYFYDGPNVEKIKNLGIPVFKITGLIHKYDAFAYFKLKKLVKKINPDVIHSALWSANIIARIIAQKLNIPIVCDLHSNISHDGTFRIWLEKFFLNKADKYIAVSNTAKDGFYNSVILKNKDINKRETYKNKMKLILNGVDSEKIYQKAFDSKLKKTDIGLNEHDFVIGTVGRLEPIKSYNLLIKSFKIFLNQDLLNQNKTYAKLCIIGDGSQKEILQKLARDLKIDKNVIFLGQKNDAYRYYPIFDCFILSSASEGLSIALLEALSIGLPIITTHNKKEHDVIKNKQNGLLVPVGNADELAKAIEKLYKEPELRQNMMSENIKLIKNQFDIKNVQTAYQQVYKELTKKK